MPADDGPAPPSSPRSELCSRLPQFITAITGEEPREFIVSEAIGAWVLGIGLEPLRQFSFWSP